VIEAQCEHTRPRNGRFCSIRELNQPTFGFWRHWSSPLTFQPSKCSGAIQGLSWNFSVFRLYSKWNYLFVAVMWRSSQFWRPGNCVFILWWQPSFSSSSSSSI